MDFSFVLIWVLVGVTCSLSGVLGMGGGLLLMGALSWLFPVGPAMVVHGLAQLAANGSRTILHLPHVSWKILPGYLIGSLMAASCFAFVKLIPSKALVFFVLGLLPFIAIYSHL